MQREPIHAALFELLRNCTKFRTASRRLKPLAQVAVSDQPALFQVFTGEQASTVPGQPTVWVLTFDVLVLVNTGSDPLIAPTEIMNPYLDAIEAALKPSPITNKQQLGGLCEHCWIEGQVEMDGGTLGDQVAALIPIAIKVSS